MLHEKNCLHKKLTELAEQFPDQEIMQIKDETGYKRYTYKQLYTEAQKVARAMVGSGIKPQDKVAIVLENRPEWAIIYFAILYAGAIAVPLDTQSSVDELNYYFANSHAKLLFTSNLFVQKIRGTTIPLAVVLDFTDDTEKTVSLNNFLNKNFSNMDLPSNDDPNAIASIIYTSGTTSFPKGVMLSHDNFYSNFWSIKPLNLISKRDNLISVLPLHHSFPFMVNMIIPLFSQAKITFLRSLKIEELLSCMQETDVTVLVAVPQLFLMVYENLQSKLKQMPWMQRWALLFVVSFFDGIRNLFKININKYLLRKVHARFGKKLRYFCSGGAKLNVNVAQFLKKFGFTIAEGYGLTETSPVVAFNIPNKVKIGSAGQVVADVQVKIENPDENGIGEIIIKGPNVTHGYFENPELTNDALKDGWFHSGDLGYLDKKGYLYITGRKKNIIVLSNGKNISPEEVEAHYGHSLYIKEVVVQTIIERGAEKLVAIIVPALDYFRKTGSVEIEGTIKTELELLSKNYPNYKQIMDFVIAKEDLPRTRLGKLKRYLIREKYADSFTLGKTFSQAKVELTAEDLALFASPVAKQVIAILAKNIPVEKQIYPHDHLGIDLGFDSLRRVELMSLLEQKLRVKISEKQMAQVFTVKELLLEVESLVVKQGKGEEQEVKSKALGSWETILAADPSSEIINSLALKAGGLAEFFALSVLDLALLFCKIIFRLKIVGKANLPRDEAFILCANHASFLDGPLIGIAFPRKLKTKLFLLGWRYFLEAPIIRRLIKVFHAVPVDDSTQLIEAMQVSAYLLRHNKILCLFPEGMRSVDGKIQRFKKGVGILARELNVKLVPAFIKGSFEAWPRGKRFFTPYPIKITFGQPYTVDELIVLGKKSGAADDYEAISAAIMEKVIELVAKDS